MKPKTKKRLIVLAIVVVLLILIEFVLLLKPYARLFSKADTSTYITVSCRGQEIELTQKDEIDKLLNVFKSRVYQARVIPYTYTGWDYKINIYDKKGGTLMYEVVTAGNISVNNWRYIMTGDISDNVTKVLNEMGKSF